MQAPPRPAQQQQQQQQQRARRARRPACSQASGDGPAPPLTAEQRKRRARHIIWDCEDQIEQQLARIEALKDEQDMLQRRGELTAVAVAVREQQVEMLKRFGVGEDACTSHLLAHHAAAPPSPPPSSPHSAATTSPRATPYHAHVNHHSSGTTAASGGIITCRSASSLDNACAAPAVALPHAHLSAATVPLVHHTVFTASSVVHRQPLNDCDGGAWQAVHPPPAGSAAPACWQQHQQLLGHAGHCDNNSNNNCNNCYLAPSCYSAGAPRRTASNGTTGTLHTAHLNNNNNNNGDAMMVMAAVAAAHVGGGAMRKSLSASLLDCAATTTTTAAAAPAGRAPTQADLCAAFLAKMFAGVASHLGGGSTRAPSPAPGPASHGAAGATDDDDDDDVLMLIANDTRMDAMPVYGLAGKWPPAALGPAAAAVAPEGAGERGESGAAVPCPPTASALASFRALGALAAACQPPGDVAPLLAHAGDGAVRRDLQALVLMTEAQCVDAFKRGSQELSELLFAAEDAACPGAPEALRRVEAAVHVLRTLGSLIQVCNPSSARAASQPVAAGVEPAAGKHWDGVARALLLTPEQARSARALDAMRLHWLQRIQEEHSAVGGLLCEVLGGIEATRWKVANSKVEVSEAEMAAKIHRVAGAGRWVLVLVDALLTSHVLTPVQVARCMVHSYPYVPDACAMVEAICRVHAPPARDAAPGAH